jgi:hypothetical protein
MTGVEVVITFNESGGLTDGWPLIARHGGNVPLTNASFNPPDDEVLDAEPDNGAGKDAPVADLSGEELPGE